MAIRLRLRRMGNRNNPFYRVVASDGRTPTTGRVKETLGWYDPEQSGVNYKLDLERVDYWTGNGAQVSDTVLNLIERARKAPPEAPAAPAPGPRETQTVEIVPEEAEESTDAAAEPAAEAPIEEKPDA